MERDLKERVEEYIKTNSVKLVQKEPAAPKQPKAPKKKAEKKEEPKIEKKEEAPAEIPAEVPTGEVKVGIMYIYHRIGTKH